MTFFQGGHKLDNTESRTPAIRNKTLIGKTLGKYRIIGHLGTGGMSEVYKAYQPGLDRYVAIKVLHAFLATEEDFLTRFQREAKFAAMLRHPNIVRVHDFDAEDQIYYMVMEFVDGPSLKTRLQELDEQGQLFPLEEVVRIVTAVANALDYAHRRGTVHRDIKPANIMFTQDDEVILMDFGIAKMVNVAGLTVSGAMVGTPAYMSPEQGMGRAGDERADIYSLGVVLYQLVTGRLPFDAETPMGIVLKHINDPVTPPTAINPNLPPGIEAVVMRALTKSPEERYQSAKELAADLKRAMTGQPVLQAAPEVTTVSPTSATAVDIQAQKQTGQWERATLPSVPTYTPPVDSARRTNRHWGTWLIALLALILISSGGFFYATGKADPLLAALAALASQIATPTPDANVTPTTTPDIFATQVAAAEAALATRDTQATYEATTSFTPSPTPSSTPTPDLTATAVATKMYDLKIVTDTPVWPSILVPGQQFTKRWEIKNTGTRTWPRGIELVFVSGEELKVVEKLAVELVTPGATTKIQVTLQAPTSYDRYTSVWQLQDIEGNPIGEDLEITFRVGATPTPRPTSTPTPTLTPKFTPTPAQPLWMSKPTLGVCNTIGGEMTWDVKGGLGGEYRYFYGGVEPEYELPEPRHEFLGYPHTMTYFTASGEIVFPVPDSCGRGDFGQCGSQEEGYEIVWEKIRYTAQDCLHPQ